MLMKHFQSISKKSLHSEHLHSRLLISRLFAVLQKTSNFHVLQIVKNSKKIADAFLNSNLGVPKSSYEATKSLFLNCFCHC